MKNMKIGQRMVGAFVIVIILSVLLAIISIWQIKTVAKTTEDLYNRPFQVVDATWEMRAYLRQIERDMLRATVENTVEATQSVLDDASNVRAQLDEASKILDPIFDGDENTERADALAGIMAKLDSLADARQKMATYALALDNDMALKVLDEEYLPTFNKAMDDLTALSQSAQSNAKAFYANSQAIASRALMIVIILAAVQAVMAILIALVITNSITKPLNKIKDAATQVAVGNVKINIDYHSKDELGNLADTFRSVIETLDLLNDDMAQLKRWATEGKILERVPNDERIKGAYQDIINGVNGIMDTFGNHFNAIPVGVGIVDTARNTLFENKTANEYKSIDKDNKQVQTSDFADEAGRTVGSLVITIDQTTVMEAQRESERQAANVAAQMAIAEKQAEYQSGEVEKLIGALDRLAKGNLDISVKQAAYDEDTRAIYENFRKLGSSLEDSCSNIRSYIDELADVLGKMSNKNLNVGITREYLGDFAELKTSINNISDTLNGVFGEISGATDQVKNGAQQVADSAQTLAQGASEQASAVEEISSTIAEVAGQTRSNAKNANKANEISLSAKSDAETGSRQMDEMVNAMEAIKEASKGIASIIKVIEDIAFQTNILALNAAVEAARAGEHGKGFAVVAEEVRTLAARSATAAKETTDMIDNSLAKVDVGSKIASETAEALSKIVSGVTNTVDIVAMIAEASAQQSTAISQIDNGVEQISKVTQTNTATAEESASASEEMAGQSQMLQSMVSEFTLKGQKSGKMIGAPKSSRSSGAEARSIPEPRADSFSSGGNEPDIEIILDDNDFGKY